MTSQQRVQKQGDVCLSRTNSRVGTVYFEGKRSSDESSIFTSVSTSSPDQKAYILW